LHTRSRNEKKVSDHLTRQNIQHFLPLAHHRRTYGGKTKEVSIPLFPGYVFLCGGPEDRHEALRTNRIANVLEVVDQEQLKRDLRQIERVVRSDEPVELYPRLQRGVRCRVIAGSLAGLEGVVLRRRGPWRVFVAVHLIAQSAELRLSQRR
jgi:transcription antitermination factor NusG